MKGSEKAKPRKKRNQHSMKWRMIGILMACWLIPFTVMFGVMGVYVGSNHSDMTAQNFQKQIEFNNKICVERLNALVAASRQASYDGELLTSRRLLEQGKISYLRAATDYKNYLAGKYQKNDGISSAVLWFLEDEKKEAFSVYNEGANATYQEIKTFLTKDQEVIAEYAETLETGIGFRNLDGRVYLVRNLVDSRFEEKAVLVLRLNLGYCLNSISEYPSGDGAYMKIDDQQIVFPGSGKLDKWVEKKGDYNRKGYDWDGARLFVTDTLTGDSYRLSTAMLLKKEVTPFPFFGYQYVMGGLLLSLLPLLLVLLRVFKKQVTDPVEVLSSGVKHIEMGELGYQMEEIQDNLEFEYLRNAFNKMSLHLKQQFDRIYQEEIALREARIMALQSNINPHFMNNTLEIINWEARLSGNIKVSRMIEALSTMMDAAMDRRKRSEVRLAEEMGYVNSYLYITKERLGKRLDVNIEIPEDLMDYLVPRLILQPVIENAIEHGAVPRGKGTVKVLGSRDDRYLRLDVINDGSLSPEESERIRQLLDSQRHTGKSEEGSLGIANVNQRLEIFFGEPCGLTITEEPQGKVRARLILPLRRFGTEIVDSDKTVQ